MPGEVYTYRWWVPASAGPGPGDGSSVLWSYHSHVATDADVMSGLIGPIIVASAESADLRTKNTLEFTTRIFVV